MKTSPRIHNFGLAIVIAVLAASANAQMIVNGSFESPPIPDGTAQLTGPALWNRLMNPNASGSVGDQFTWPQAHTGQQYVELGPELTQSFTISSAGFYRISWQDNTALNVPIALQTAPYSVSLLDSTGFRTYAVVNLDSYHGGIWGGKTLSRTIAPGTYMLRFSSLSLPNQTTTLIDSVGITLVPEPSSVGLLVIAASVFMFGWKNINR